jgi:hypothetical protein
MIQHGWRSRPAQITAALGLFCLAWEYILIGIGLALFVMVVTSL